MAEEIEGEDSFWKSTDEGWKFEDAVVVDVDPPRDKDVDPLWVKYMKAKLASKSIPWQSSHPVTICRVPPEIRRVDSVAYDPLIVSVGPYHRGNPSLREMEEIKWRNLSQIRRQASNDDFDECLKAMKKIEPQVRACYSGNINMEADEFIEMMLLDGLFIIQLLLKKKKVHKFLFQLVRINSYGKNPSFTIDGMLCRIGHDMLLLENQLPFFVMERLWNLIYRREKQALWKKACIFIRRSAMRFLNEWNFDHLTEILTEETKKYKNKKEPELNVGVFHHLLHLVCLFLKPTLMPTKPESMECSEVLAAVTEKKKNEILRFLSSSKSRKEPPRPLQVIPCASELVEAGVVFKCVKAKSFLDVKFEQGTIEVPRLSVQYFTKSLFRNFIAFEQCFPNRGSYFTSYCSFMDHLVNTPRDVEILKLSAVIENRLGSDEEVARLFNDLLKGVCVSDLSRSYLEIPYKDVMEHAQQLLPRWRAKLVRDYFSSPWSIISLVAAIFVIFLTAVQTYYAVFT